MESVGELLGFHHPDEMREFFRKKSKKMTKKLMNLKDAVSLVNEGNYISIGGFGTVRIPTTFIHELLRTKKKNLTAACFTSNVDTDC